MQSELSEHFGFGHGTLVRLPSDWDENCLEMNQNLLMELGFRPLAPGRLNNFSSSVMMVYHIPNFIADKIQPEIEALFNSKNLAMEEKMEFNRKVENSFVNQSFDSNIDPMDEVTQHFQHSMVVEDKFLAPKEPLSCGEKEEDDIPFLLDSSGVMLKTFPELELTEAWYAKRKRNRARRLSRAIFHGTTTPKKHIERKSLFGIQEINSVLTIEEASNKTSSCLNQCIRFVLQAQCLSDSQINEELSCVSREWRKEAQFYSAKLKSNYRKQDISYEWGELCEAFPWGKYLSDGAYKEVFQVILI